MADLGRRIEAEYESLDELVSGLPAARTCADLSPLELAGVATLLHNFYSGLENVLKLVFRAKDLPLPAGESWHRDLLEAAVREAILHPATVEGLRPYLAFRHFFIHSYALDLNAARLEPLVNQAAPVYADFKEAIATALAG